MPYDAQVRRISWVSRARPARGRYVASSSPLPAGRTLKGRRHRRPFHGRRRTAPLAMISLAAAFRRSSPATGGGLLFVVNAGSALEGEGDLAVHPEPGDFPVLDDCLEFLDVNGADI